MSSPGGELLLMSGWRRIVQALSVGESFCALDDGLKQTLCLVDRKTDAIAFLPKRRYIDAAFIEARFLETASKIIRDARVADRLGSTEYCHSDLLSGKSFNFSIQYLCLSVKLDTGSKI